MMLSLTDTYLIVGTFESIQQARFVSQFSLLFYFNTYKLKCLYKRTEHLFGTENLDLKQFFVMDFYERTTAWWFFSIVFCVMWLYVV